MRGVTLTASYTQQHCDSLIHSLFFTPCTNKFQPRNSIGKGMWEVRVIYPIPQNSYANIGGTQYVLNTA